VAAANQAGIATGIFAMDSAGARQYREAGFRFIAVAADVVWLLRATRQALAGGAVMKGISQLAVRVAAGVVAACVRLRHLLH
jgi:2-keto-3-deoxy-L-rhamnonate aldolase RhmA